MTPFEFEAAHGAAWQELEQALARGERSLDPERFLRLYRSACEHLALAKSRGYPTDLIDRLSILTASAHQIIYRQNDYGTRRIARALLEEFPAEVRAQRRYVALAAALLFVPALVLGFIIHHRPEIILSVVDSTTAQQFAQMYSPDNPAIGRARSMGGNWMMFGYYILNNISIAFQCYVTGVLFGLGSLFFLLYNGAFSGAIAGYITSAGYGGTFFPFVATHSAFELTAIVLAGGAGLKIGHAVLLPGRLTRTAALAAAARRTGIVIAGCGVMLLIAAALEAFWSSAAWVAPQAKYAFAACCWTLVAFFFLRKPHAA
jgi:uncharacterized membrane protein SpoIIM required for sporulation